MVAATISTVLINHFPSVVALQGGEHSVILILQNDPDHEDQNYDNADLNP
jgi:hypothetical protein